MFVQEGETPVSNELVATEQCNFYCGTVVLCSPTFGKVFVSYHKPVGSRTFLAALVPFPQQRICNYQ
jgi:hypothetical protein